MGSEAGEAARTAPGGFRWDGADLCDEHGRPATPSVGRVHAALRAVILDPEFPCLGARAAVNRASYRFGLYGELASTAATEALARDLDRFARGIDTTSEYSTCIASFTGPKAITPEEFERLLWVQLQRLHELDALEWQPSVSSDPGDERFSFSFGGCAFFVVGLSPVSARWARRFPWPTLAFNPHEQFERLREDGRFNRLQEAVRSRDLRLEGDLNPNLADFGAHTEARQYSGRPVGDDWRCPVRFE